MKNPIYLFFFGLMIILSSCSVPNAASGFYKDHKRKEGVRNFSLPGWLIYTGTGFAHDIVKDEEIQGILHLAKKVKKMQLMVDEGNGAIQETDIASFQQHLRKRDFEDFIYVRSEDTTVSFMVHSKKDKLRDMVMLVHTDEDFVFLNMRTNIKVKHIAQLVEYLIKLDDGEEEDPTPPEPPAEKPLARPRA